MVERQNKNTGLMEVHVPGLVTEIREKVLNLNNEKLTAYRLGNCQINYPDGGKGDVLTRFYSKSIKAHPDVFKVGGQISLSISTEGEFAGRAVAHLPGATVDIARLLGIKAVETATMVPSMQESIVEDNVIEQELVI